MSSVIPQNDPYKSHVLIVLNVITVNADQHSRQFSLSCDICVWLLEICYIKTSVMGLFQYSSPD